MFSACSYLSMIESLPAVCARARAPARVPSASVWKQPCPHAMVSDCVRAQPATVPLGGGGGRWENKMHNRRGGLPPSSHTRTKRMAIISISKKQFESRVRFYSCALVKHVQIYLRALSRVKCASELGGGNNNWGLNDS